MVNQELVFYFTKPHLRTQQQKDAEQLLLRKISKRADITIADRGITRELPVAFWQGHYGYLAEVAPDWTEELRRMIFDFSYMYGRGICWGVLEGDVGLTRIAREVVGDKKNPAAGTVRKQIMVPNGIAYNTGIHVSDLGRVKTEIINLQRFLEEFEIQEA